MTVEVWALSGGAPLAAGLGAGLQQLGQHNCKQHLSPPDRLACDSQEHAAVAQLGLPPWHACSSVMLPLSMHEMARSGGTLQVPRVGMSPCTSAGLPH